jgi:hypothetical protein
MAAEELIFAFKQVELAFYNQVAAFREKRNSQTQLYKLPADVVLVILDYVTSARDEAHRNNDKLRFGNLNNPIFQFCSYFRRTAINSPTAWTNIWAYSDSEARELLSRSQGSLLEILGPQTCKSVQLNMWRCRSIQLPCRLHNSRLPTSLWEVCAPVLLSLSVCDPNQTIDKVPRVPLFGGEAPKLQSLHINWLPEAIDPVLSRLVNLELCSIRQMRRHTFFQVLSTCQALQCLVTEDCKLKSDQAPGQEQEIRIEEGFLPSLRKLSLDEQSGFRHVKPLKSVGNFLFPFYKDLLSLELINTTRYMRERIEFFMIPVTEEAKSWFPRLGYSDTLVLDSCISTGITYSVGRAERHRVRIVNGSLFSAEIDEALLYDFIATFSLTNLTKLDLIGAIPGQALLQVLQVTPRLASLRMKFLSLSSKPVSSIKYISAHNSATLLIELRELQVDAGRHLGLLDSIIEFVEHRSNGPWARLRNLTVPVYELEMDWQKIERLSSLVGNLLYKSSEGLVYEYQRTSGLVV